jgi:surfactin synthase thioesterase subunit
MDRSTPADEPASDLTWSPREANHWFSRALRGACRARVFAFPHSGGAGVANFSSWLKIWPASIELCAVELPGRPARVAEPPFRDFRSLGDAILEQVEPLCDVPFAVFGASIGGAMAYYLVRDLEARGLRPRHLFLASCPVPTYGVPHRAVYHDLPDADFIKVVERAYGGTMSTRLKPEVLRALMPGLRADFEMMETNRVPPDPQPVRCPITAYAGVMDSMLPVASIEAWGGWTDQPFSFHALDRAHFFLVEERERIVRDIEAQLGS